MNGRGRETEEGAPNAARSGASDRAGVADEAGGSGADAGRGRPVLRSILGTGQRRWLRFGLGVAVFMLANTLYLLANRLADGLGLEFFAVGENSLPQLFQAMVLTHTGVGLLLAAIMFGFLAAHLPTVWKRKHRASILTGIGMGLVGGVLVLTGLFILTAAASRENSWAWWAHVGSAVLIVSAYAGHRLVSYARPPGVRARRFALATGAVLVVLVAWHSLTHRGLQLTPEAEAALAQGLNEGPGGRDRDVSRFVDADFVPTGLVPPESPFFPAATTTSTGTYLPSRIITRTEAGELAAQAARERAARVRAEVERRGFAADELIGATQCVRCHPDVTAQWATSAHRFASFNNPFYTATIEDMREGSLEAGPEVIAHLREFGLEPDAAGRVKSKWCSGCHDPALMLAGAMDAPIDPATVEAQAGLTCLACHAIDRIHDNTGNGNYNIADEQEDPYLFAEAEAGTLGAYLHDAALKAKPSVHMAQLLKPVHSTSEFCATCHKVSLTEPVNNYRWLRGQNEYDAWHDSGVARNASRTFYLPAAARVCQDCHMPPEEAPLGDVSAEDGMVRSHRFLAVNTALPFLRGDTATIRRTEEFLRDEKLRVDIFAIRRGPNDDPEMGLDLSPPSVSPGETVMFEVVVRNQGVGHTFPGGTNDSNEGWLEFELVDAEGRRIAISGEIGADGYLDPMAHFFKSVILDREGRPIQKRNAQDIHVTAAVNVIGPGSADVAHYRITLPPDLPEGSLTARARLLWRKFDRAYTEFAFGANPQGFAEFDDVPELPITEIARDEVTIGVGGRVDPVSTEEQDEEIWVRYNDYGIALLMEGNDRLAERPFERVAEFFPDRVDGPLNLARMALIAGNLDDAFDNLERAETIEAGNPRVAWVWGGAHQEDGAYDASEAAYLAVLDAFPEDREAWFQLGRTRYLAQRYEAAVEAFDRTLAIDPEHRQAHYSRMLSLRALGRDEEAALGEAAFERYRIDEAAQAITRAYRAENPGVNLMAQDIRTHELRPIAPAGGAASADRSAGGAASPDRPARGGGGR
ncbi:MAG: tetratricopeptide repeat protein [Gemmatimonadota bacterium]|uniref:tetratricopeptide repeat protein n=1 Tax=Candidatus Palauibacter scopulicola TaxID=3056741 RepID=UPI0023A6B7CC|nr:tetratricopeptide repeat protein [Candidatus Palauibacter scopulicola]MDE2662252.1 tetratricopeptide repeat protein [Candidatus Palauibacter scopulicola]